MNKNQFRVACHQGQLGLKLDPARIVSIGEYELLNNLYGKLLSQSLDGRLTADVPESFHSDGKKITFEFAAKVKTLAGYTVTAEDAAASIKRLMLLGHSHGDLAQFLCPQRAPTTIDDPCPGLVVSGNRLILEPIESHHLSMLISTLQNADFSIIPRHAIGSGPEYDIINFKETSGPFYLVDGSSQMGALRLKANMNHYLYDPDMPQEVECVPVGLLDGLEKFESGAIDLLPGSQLYSSNLGQKILADKNLEIHETIPIKVSIIGFSKKAFEDFDAWQRLKAARILADAAKQIFPSQVRKTTSQFFQAQADGSLTAHQIEGIRSHHSLREAKGFPRPMVFKFSSPKAAEFRERLKAYPEITVVDEKQEAFTLPENRIPDVMLFSNDSSWTEDLSLLYYNISTGYFHLGSRDLKLWLNKYLELPEQSSRISMLNELHFSMLKEVSFYPFAVSPYFAVTRKEWKLNQSNLLPSTELWRIRRN